MSTSHFLPYTKQNISQEDLLAVSNALTQSIITRGPQVQAFEESVATYCGAQYAVAFNSGTSALKASFFAANLGMGDRVISSPNTFIASVGGAVQRFATPVFVDIDPSTGNMNVEQVIYNLNHPSTRGKTAVVPVHFAGIPMDVQAIDAKISHPETVIIEDAAHALGSCYKDGTRVGNCQWSQMTVFSFHPAKTITTGEGGMVTTNDEELYHKLRLFRNNGIENDPFLFQEHPGPWHYEVNALTGNFHLTEMQAALGLSQMRRLPQFIEKRQHLLNLYKNKLAAVPHVKCLNFTGLNIAPHLCVVQIDFSAYKKTRAQVMEKLYVDGIGTQVHYIPLYHHPIFKERSGDISEYFPQTEKYFSQALSLPLYVDLTEDNVDYVVKTLIKNLKH